MHIVTKNSFNKIVLVVIVFLLLTIIFCTYQGPVNGVVIDANTGQPIEGAVVARWVAGYPIWWGGWKHNIERKTDQFGKYYFHGFFLLKPLLAFEASIQKEFLVYKDGYAACGSNGPYGTGLGSFFGVAQTYTQKDSVIKLRRLPSDNPKLHEDNAHWISDYMGPSWATGPSTLEALQTEQQKSRRCK